MFYALKRMPLADATAFLFTTPLFTILIVSAVMHEPVGLRRWLAILAGFAGALVIVRPGLVEVSWPVAVMAVSALGFGVVNGTTRRICIAGSTSPPIFRKRSIRLCGSRPLNRTEITAGWRSPGTAGW